MKNYLNLTNNN